jgi:hypothetical protein
MQTCAALHHSISVCTFDLLKIKEEVILWQTCRSAQSRYDSPLSFDCPTREVHVVYAFNSERVAACWRIFCCTFMKYMAIGR